MLGKMVLDDSLFMVYEHKKDIKKLNHLMKKFVAPYATNWAQLRRVRQSGLEMSTYEQILSQMANQPYKDFDLEELANETTFKIILTEDSNKQFPYVHYKKGMVDKNIVISLSAADDRADLKKYLQKLCEKSHKITICDNYFSNNWENTRSLFHSILPKHKLLIEYAAVCNNINAVQHSTVITTAFVKSICNDWEVKQSTYAKYNNCHDRYLLIENNENKIEIMFSSGFDHIWKENPKELSCLFSEVS